MFYAQSEIRSANEALDEFKDTVEESITTIEDTTRDVQTTADQLCKNMEGFRDALICDEEVQIANERIMNIDQIIKERFSNHIAIRRTVMGVVRDFDISLVRSSTIEELSQELWLTSSRYWLSYALIAITAWVNDYPDQARNALSESVRKDSIKTNLFFCLVNLRFGRMKAARKWFYAYFRTLDPTMLQQETAILLQSFLDGIFGRDKELEHDIIELIDDWLSIINESEQISRELLDSYERYINNLNPQTNFRYASILEFCLDSGKLQKIYRDVSKFQLLLDFVKSLDVEAEPQYDSNYKDRVDAILINLISNYDADELKLRQDQESFRCIVENRGDLKKAREKYANQTALTEQNFNIGKQMIDWAAYDDDGQTDIQVRKFGFQNTRRWFARAVANFDDRLQEAMPTEFTLRIDTWTGVTNGNDHAQQLESIRNHFENNKFQNIFLNNPNILAALLFIASLGLAFVTPYVLIAAAAAASFMGIRSWKALREYPQRIRAAIDHFNAVMSELAEFRRSCGAERAKKDEILSIAKFL